MQVANQISPAALIRGGLTPFDHDNYNSMAEHDLQEQEAMKAAKVPDGMTVAFISYQPTKAGHDYFGIARTPDSRDFPFTAPPAFISRLLQTAYIGTPVRLSPTLHAIEV